ncbi:MAG: hypothetical protein IKM00_03195, partial [Clostridia bacterium]|nr:hypothetical protein [Clostridia bacterium]
VGADVETGATLSQTLGRLHPAALAYALYSPHGRASFDQTAVYQAILPENDLFELSERGRMSLDDQNATVWTPDPAGSTAGSKRSSRKKPSAQ